ncbi:hypothetical protein [Candidatus Pantoea floridensis]|uniref:Uncharacterized protein n=1 Tax=Candidatus Pantoea floridensis TaxID=1938870 RepID=A0A286DSI7_9GAMM|nr:hypothetical protein [Pantoea floridensis]PIF06914.1 hypothetical protein BX596_5214 [Enterobacteriaceae bacterium JKS000233]SOD61573.1 hypothetical protein SAMN06273570_5205 [Pantoea floridensis]
MKQIFRTAFDALALSAGLSGAVFAAQPVSDVMVSQKPDQMNASVQLINSSMQQMLIALNQSAQNGTCWLDGKAFSQGAVATVAGHASACGLQHKTGWPQWRPVTEHNPELFGE